jgi:hypothetical protein
VKWPGFVNYNSNERGFVRSVCVTVPGQTAAGAFIAHSESPSAHWTPYRKPEINGVSNDKTYPSEGSEYKPNWN